jgi:aromatic ring-opening dioxygenase catalytic subunit (LigB family)
MNPSIRQPTYFLCHGGGPWPWLQGPLRQTLRHLEHGLRELPTQLPARPSAILVVSAHWEEKAFSFTSSPAPGMVYDYYGFPPETYSIHYASPGAPGLASRAADLLRAAGCNAALNDMQGYDHSTYSLMQPMFPQADIPVVQMSIQTSMRAEDHLRAGAALAPLRDENVLIIGSGMSVHERGPEMATASPIFDDWLNEAVLTDHGALRWKALAEWEKAPFARNVHPTADHLLPLMVAAGAAQEDTATCIYRERLMGTVAVSSFRFGD